MQHLPLWAVFIVLPFVNICDTKRQKDVADVPYILTRLFKSDSKKPLILLLEPKENDGKILKPKIRTHNKDSSSDDSSSSDDDLNLRSSQNDERAYVLFHLLRTTLEHENLDPKTADSLENTKQYLRKSLIARCGKLDRCKDNCARKSKIKFTCTLKCEQIYDDLNACGEVEKPMCNKPKCGKTMPPAWL